MSSKPKAIFRHCQDAYAAMLSQSDLDKNEAPYPIYTGLLTKLIVDELYLSNSYYTLITKELMRMDCIRNIQRGGVAQKSRWLLLKEPNEHDFETMVADPRLTKRQLAEIQFKQDVLERLARIERQLGIISES